MNTSTQRSYKQFCPIAKALDVIGERWTLLIVRELFSGPKRFKDLMDALPGIGTNLLSTRMKDMEAHGLVEKSKLPPPAASNVYQLTQQGYALNEVMAALIRWGFQFLDKPQDDELLQPHCILQGLLVMFDPKKAEGISEVYEFRVENEIFQVRVHKQQAQGNFGQTHPADMIIVANTDELIHYGFIADSHSLINEKPNMLLQGDLEMLLRFRRMFLER